MKKFFYEYMYNFYIIEYTQYKTHYHYFANYWIRKLCYLLERQENKATRRGKKMSMHYIKVHLELTLHILLKFYITRKKLRFYMDKAQYIKY